MVDVVEEEGEGERAGGGENEIVDEEEEGQRAGGGENEVVDEEGEGERVGRGKGFLLVHKPQAPFPGWLELDGSPVALVQ